MRFRFTNLAERDLLEIGDFIARDNPAKAATFVATLREKCRQLTAFPESSPLRSEFGQGVRLSVHGRYLIFYVAHEDLLEIRRVVHGARDLSEDGLLV